MDKIKHILDLYELGQIKQVKNVPSSGNVLFDIKSDRGGFLLRFNPSGGPRWRSREEVLAEIEVLDILESKGVPVVSALENHEGERVVEFNGAFGYLRTYVDGASRLDPSVDDVYKVGELLGQMHVITHDLKTKHDRKHRWGLDETKVFFEQKKSLLPEGFAQKIQTELERLSFDPDLPQGMIHEDFGKRHVLWEGDGIVGVIDFDRMYYGSLVLDLGQAARGWCFDGDWETWNWEKCYALVAGYESRRSLSVSEKNAFIDAVRFALLERALSFMIRSIEHTHSEDDRTFAEHSLCLLLQIENTPFSGVS